MKKILYFILIMLIIIFITLLYGRFIGTTGLTTNEIIIQETNLPSSYQELKIIHFSDLHYKKVITEQRVKELITAINKTKPDLVLFTGDLLDQDYSITNQDINFLIKQLTKITSTYGNFAILGDHDKQHEETVQNIYLQSNFTLLKNSSTIIYNTANDPIFLGGLDSYLTNDADLTKTMDYFNSNEDIPYKIILIHEPDLITNITTTYPTTSLILAAHSINGSINLPIIKNLFLPTGAKKFTTNQTQINQTNIYISNGIGVNTINFRLFNTPSINFYRIRHN